MRKFGLQPQFQMSKRNKLFEGNLYSPASTIKVPGRECIGKAQDIEYVERCDGRNKNRVLELSSGLVIT